jgi:hypothetical protein
MLSLVSLFSKYNINIFEDFSFHFSFFVEILKYEGNNDI